MESYRDLMGCSRIEWVFSGIYMGIWWYSDENITIIQP